MNLPSIALPLQRDVDGINLEWRAVASLRAAMLFLNLASYGKDNIPSLKQVRTCGEE